MTDRAAEELVVGAMVVAGVVAVLVALAWQFGPLALAVGGLAVVLIASR